MESQTEAENPQTSRKSPRAERGPWERRARGKDQGRTEGGSSWAFRSEKRIMAFLRAYHGLSSNEHTKQLQLPWKSNDLIGREVQ